jgi:hypothetical protein
MCDPIMNPAADPNRAPPGPGRGASKLRQLMRRGNRSSAGGAGRRAGSPSQLESAAASVITALGGVLGSACIRAPLPPVTMVFMKVGGWELGLGWRGWGWGWGGVVAQGCFFG